MNKLRRLFALSVKFKRLTLEAKSPTKAYPESAGFDLYAIAVERSPFRVTYRTGIAVEIPEGYVGLLFPRSSVYKSRQQMANSVGVIDADYRGEITAVFNLYTGMAHPYNVGDRVAQLIIMPIPQVTLQEVEELSESARGEGGYGSSGS